MPDRFEVLECDVLVIGAGGAGLRAAISATQAGCRVIVACKSLLGKAHTVMAEGGIAAAFGNMNEPDSRQVHFVDTMKGGAFLNNWRMVEIFTQEAPERVLELERYGAVFDRTPDGLIAQRPFGGHAYRRLNYVGDRTGLELIRALQDKAVSLGIEVFMEVTLTRLIQSAGRITAAFGYRRESGDFILFKAKSIVLATGGWGRMYRYTSNSWESTSDGVMMAFEAGAELMDMEMVQFHPTGMIWPPGARGLLVTEGVRGEGGILRNNRGEHFMFNPQYTPPVYRGQFAETEEEARLWLEDKKNNRRPPELLPRDIVSRAIYQETQAGRGTEHGGVYLDISYRKPAYIKRTLPSMFEQFKDLANIDITRQPMEVYPTIHYTMGGVRVDPETAETSLPGLYAAGEVTSGLHGANRLGGNSLSDLLVFGKRAGEAAALHAKKTALDEIDRTQLQAEIQLLLGPLESQGLENPYDIISELQEAMQSNAMIARTEKTLSTCLEKILELQGRANSLRVESTKKYNPGWHAARDVHFMLKTSEIIVRCALERTESRGAHWRLDHPELDPDWGGKNLIARKGDDGAVLIAARPRPEMPSELSELFNKKEKRDP